MNTEELISRLRLLRRRVWALGAAGGAVWGILGGLALLLVGAWIDLVWELSPESRIAAGILAVAAGLVVIALMAVRTARAAHWARVARRLDRAGGTGGVVLTGWELHTQTVGGQTFLSDRKGTDKNVCPPGLSAGLAVMAVGRAAVLAAEIPPPRAVPAKPLHKSLIVLACAALALLILGLCLPDLVRSQWNRFLFPYRDVPPFSPIRFQVEPDSAQVIYGGDLDITATVSGGAVEQVELALEWNGEQERPRTEGDSPIFASQKSGQSTEIVPMFPEANGRWRASLTKVTAAGTYYVQSARARSERHRLELITVPRLEGVKFRITPPAYANRAPYEGPLPNEGLAGLRGTKVRVWATSNRPLGGGKIVITTSLAPGKSIGSKAGPTSLTPGESPGAKMPGVTMRPTAEGGNEVCGEFEIAADGKFELRVADIKGQESQESFSGKIALLPDERPFIRILRPEPKAMATPNAVLPVVMEAEDDQGLSRIELYRNLNDSRSLPQSVLQDPVPPRRSMQVVGLPLNRYGLEPGDVIKVFGRAEDNDPAEAKGAESAVCTVEIISQEEYERILMKQRGFEMLKSKYQEGKRRMESLADEIEQLRKKNAERSKNETAQEKKENRRRLQQLARRMRRESEALRKLSKRNLPMSLDAQLNSSMEQLANLTEQQAEELDKLWKEAEQGKEAIERQLAKMAKKVGHQRELYNESAMDPIEHLAGVYPLLVDQSRFALLVLRQKDLAERAANLKDGGKEESSQQKSRMRDLADEQAQLLEALLELLDDIEGHAAMLPQVEELDELRQTAEDFAREVRASEADKAMQGAESALNEFDGDKAAEQTQKAAEILDKFLAKCKQGMGGGAQGSCRRFQPSISQAMGATMQQMLDGMDPSSGAQDGSGMNGESETAGLYGSLPETENAEGREPEGADLQQYLPTDASTRGSGDMKNSDGTDSLESGQSGGRSEEGVPLRYRRQVGEYFHRLAEELEGKK